MAARKTNGRGRPPASEPLKKRVIRTTDAQWDEYRRASGGNLNAWIRKILDRAARRA